MGSQSIARCLASSYTSRGKSPAPYRSPKAWSQSRPICHSPELGGQVSLKMATVNQLWGAPRIHGELSWPTLGARRWYSSARTLGHASGGADASHCNALSCCRMRGGHCCGRFSRNPRPGLRCLAHRLVFWTSVLGANCATLPNRAPVGAIYWCTVAHANRPTEMRSRPLVIGPAAGPSGRFRSRLGRPASARSRPTAAARSSSSTPASRSRIRFRPVPPSSSNA